VSGNGLKRARSTTTAARIRSAAALIKHIAVVEAENGYRYLGDKTGPIKPLSEPLKREILPRPRYFNKRVLPCIAFILFLYSVF